jgi:hypothetical protein
LKPCPDPRAADHAVHEAALGIDANMGLHAEVLLVPLPGLVHLTAKKIRTITTALYSAYWIVIASGRLPGT